MSQIDQLRADNRRPAGDTPAIAPSTHTSAAVAKAAALALGGLVCLAFGSHVIRADTLSGIDGSLGPARPGVDGASVREESTSVPGSSISSLMRRSGRSYLDQAYKRGMAGQVPPADPPVPPGVGPSALDGLSPLPTGPPPWRSEHFLAAGSGPFDGEETSRSHAANEQTAGPIGPHPALPMAYLPEPLLSQPDLPKVISLKSRVPEPKPQQPKLPAPILPTPERQTAVRPRPDLPTAVPSDPNLRRPMPLRPSPASPAAEGPFRRAVDKVAQGRFESMQKGPQPSQVKVLRQVNTTSAAEPGASAHKCDLVLPPICQVTTSQPDLPKVISLKSRVPEPKPPQPKLPAPILPTPERQTAVRPKPDLPTAVPSHPNLRRSMPLRPSPASLAAERPVRLPSTGVRQAGAVSVEETAVDDNVARARPEPMQEGSQPKQASQLLQPRETGYLRPEQVAFQDTFAGEPIPFPMAPEPLGNQSGMSLGACGMDLPPIGAVTTDIRPSEGDLPFDCARTKLAQLGQVSPGEPACREWPQILYPWEATSYCHRPLYFEEINLERYGYMWCDHRCCGVPAALVQPVLSGAHFFASVPLLPYKMTVDPACECIYTLGHYRPGSPVPHQIHRLPLRPVAGGVEAVAITGLIFAIP